MHDVEQRLSRSNHDVDSMPVVGVDERDCNAHYNDDDDDDDDDTRINDDISAE